MIFLEVIETFVFHLPSMIREFQAHEGALLQIQCTSEEDKQYIELLIEHEFVKVVSSED